MQREALVLFPLILSVVLPGSQVVSSYTDTKQCPVDLYVALSFLVPSLGDCPCLHLSGLSTPFPHLRVSASFHLGSPSPCHGLETLNTASWDNYRVHLIYFPSLRNHFFSLPNDQYFENHFFMDFVWLIWGQRINLNSNSLVKISC